MSKYIDADLYVEMQLYDDEHEEWSLWNGTVEDLLNQWTEEGCPTAIEVSEDCISRRKLMSELAGIWDTDTPNIPKTMADFQEMLEDTYYKIKNAPSVKPERPKGEWAEVEKSEHGGLGIVSMRCNQCGRYAYLVLPKGTKCVYDYCPWCNADMRSEK